MPNLTLGLGVALILLGVISYVATGFVSITALIPAFFGILFVLLGLAGGNERYRMHAMHGAALLALLGFLGSVRALFTLLAWVTGTTIPTRPAAIVSQSIMALLTGAFVVLAIKSFIDARRARG